MLVRLYLAAGFFWMERAPENHALAGPRASCMLLLSRLMEPPACLWSL